MPQDPSAIERDIEQTRTRLAETIDQLVYRSSPKTIVRREIAAVRDFFLDERGDPRTENVVKVAGGVLLVIGVLGLARRVTR